MWDTNTPIVRQILGWTLHESITDVCFLCFSYFQTLLIMNQEGASLAPLSIFSDRPPKLNRICYFLMKTLFHENPISNNFAVIYVLLLIFSYHICLTMKIKSKISLLDTSDGSFMAIYHQRKENNNGVGVTRYCCVGLPFDYILPILTYMAAGKTLL